jgi:hypothetical protein
MTSGATRRKKERLNTTGTRDSLFAAVRRPPGSSFRERQAVSVDVPPDEIVVRERVYSSVAKR